MVLTTHYAQLRKAHPQGRLGQDEPPFPLTRRRAEKREVVHQLRRSIAERMGISSDRRIGHEGGLDPQFQRGKSLESLHELVWVDDRDPVDGPAALRPETVASPDWRAQPR